MGNKKYIEGGILINTPYFTCINCGSGYSNQPEDTEILATNHIEDGHHCLLIDDDHPQSIFNEYYAKTFVSASYIGSSYIRNSYLDCCNEYVESIRKLSNLSNKVKEWENEESALINKMVYLNIISTFDSFVCSVMLVRLVHDEPAFNLYAENMFGKLFRKQLDELKLNKQDGMREQKIIDRILETSFANVATIKDAMKFAGFSIASIDMSQMSKHFHNRHILVHRNGKTKNGEFLHIGCDEIMAIVECANNFVAKIILSILEVLDKELDDASSVFNMFVVESRPQLLDLVKKLLHFDANF